MSTRDLVRKTFFAYHTHDIASFAPDEYFILEKHIIAFVCISFYFPRMASLFRGKKPSKNAPVIHRVKIRTSPSPTPLQSATSKSNSQRGQTSNDPRPRSTSLPAVTLAPSAADSSKSNKRKRLNSRNPSPALQQRIDFDSDDDNEEAALDFSDKRQRLPAPENVDRKRRLVAKSPFSRTDEAVLIHAVTRHKKGLPLALDLVGIEDSIVFLNYPGAPFRERCVEMPTHITVPELMIWQIFATQIEVP